MVFERYLAKEWPSYIVGPDLEVVRFGASHPVDAGVYFMFDDDSRLIYIGQSLGISLRLAQHHWAGRRCAGFGAVSVPWPLFRSIETAYIHALEPPLNRKYLRPECPDVHEQIVEAIRAKWAETLVEA